MEVMEAYFKALAKPNTSVTTDAYNIWRIQNPTKRPNMDAKIKHTKLEKEALETANKAIKLHCT